MNSQSKAVFDDYTPDELSELYQENPALFNELADEAIRQACIGSTPEKTLKSRQLQWTIDGQLRKAKSALGRMQIMESIFYSKVYGADGQLAQLVSSCTDLVRTLKGTDQVSGRNHALCSLRK